MGRRGAPRAKGRDGGLWWLERAQRVITSPFPPIIITSDQPWRVCLTERRWSRCPRALSKTEVRALGTRGAPRAKGRDGGRRWLERAQRVITPSPFCPSSSPPISVGRSTRRHDDGAARADVLCVQEDVPRFQGSVKPRQGPFAEAAVRRVFQVLF